MFLNRFNNTSYVPSNRTRMNLYDNFRQGSAMTLYQILDSRKKLISNDLIRTTNRISMDKILFFEKQLVNRIYSNFVNKCSKRGSKHLIKRIREAPKKNNNICQNIKENYNLLFNQNDSSPKNRNRSLISCPFNWITRANDYIYQNNDFHSRSFMNFKKEKSLSLHKQREIAGKTRKFQRLLKYHNYTKTGFQKSKYKNYVKVYSLFSNEKIFKAMTRKSQVI